MCQFIAQASVYNIYTEIHGDPRISAYFEFGARRVPCVFGPDRALARMSTVPPWHNTRIPPCRLAANGSSARRSHSARRRMSTEAPCGAASCPAVGDYFRGQVAPILGCDGLQPIHNRMKPRDLRSKAFGVIFRFLCGCIPRNGVCTKISVLVCFTYARNVVSKQPLPPILTELDVEHVVKKLVSPAFQRAARNTQQ